MDRPNGQKLAQKLGHKPVSAEVAESLEGVQFLSDDFLYSAEKSAE